MANWTGVVLAAGAGLLVLQTAASKSRARRAIEEKGGTVRGMRWAWYASGRYKIGAPAPWEVDYSDAQGADRCALVGPVGWEGFVPVAVAALLFTLVALASVTGLLSSGSAMLLAPLLFGLFAVAGVVALVWAATTQRYGILMDLTATGTSGAGDPPGTTDALVQPPRPVARSTVAQVRAAGAAVAMAGVAVGLAAFMLPGLRLALLWLGAVLVLLGAIFVFLVD